MYFNANHSLNDPKSTPIFYSLIHNIYMKHFKLEPKTPNEIMSEPLWYNKYIALNNKHIHIKEWDNNNIKLIKDIVNNQGEILNHNELVKKYKITTNYLTTLQIVHSIPKHWLKLIKNIPINKCENQSEIFIIINNKNLPLSQIKSNTFYWHMINQKYTPPTSVTKWTEIYPSLVDHNRESTFHCTFTFCRETKLQTFQYRILHRIIPCRKWLFNIKISDTNICPFCTLYIDTLPHFFLLCYNADLFWVSFNNWWFRITNKHLIDISENSNLQLNLLFGFPDQSSSTMALNYCILLAKYFIYIRKIQQSNQFFFIEYLSYLKSKLNQEKYILKITNKLYKFEKFIPIMNYIS